MSSFPGFGARLINRVIQNRFIVSVHPTVATLIIAVAILASTLLFQAIFLRAALRMEDRANDIIGAERELLALNVDMETGLRGFQYTGRA